MSLLAVGGLTYVHYEGNPWGAKAAAADPATRPINGREVTSRDGRVQLHIPNDAAASNVAVKFQNEPQLAKSLNASARGLSALGSPVSITTSSRIKPNASWVTIKYGQLPKGVTPANLGMAVFDPTLKAWIPIMSAKVDIKTHTVTALAPHYSNYALVFLNGAKSVVTAAGHTVRVTITGTMTIAEWFAKVAAELARDFVKDLTAHTEPLSCRPQSQSVVSNTTSFRNWMTACTESTRGSDTTLRLRNGFAFPMRINPLPKGMDVSLNDIWTNGGDLVSLFRNAFWATQHEAVLSGASLGSLTATSALQSKVTVTANLDNTAVVSDIVMAVVSVVLPEKSLAEDGVKAFVKSLLLHGKNGEASKLEPYAQVYDAMDCAINNGHQDVSNLFSFAGAQAASRIAQSCLTAMLSHFNLESALASLLSGIVKTVPETIETALAHSLQQLSGFRLNSTGATITVSYNPFGQFVGSWGVHGGVSLTINRDGSSNEDWSAGSCGSSFSDPNPPWCTGHATLSLKPASGGQLSGSYTHVWYTSTTGKVPANYSPLGEPKAGDHFTLWRNDAHTLKIKGGNYIGNPYLCDSYARSHTDPRCGA